MTNDSCLIFHLYVTLAIWLIMIRLLDVSLLSGTSFHKVSELFVLTIQYLLLFTLVDNNVCFYGACSIYSLSYFLWYYEFVADDFSISKRHVLIENIYRDINNIICFSIIYFVYLHM